MTTIASRTFRSSPHRDARQTWTAIVHLLTGGNSGKTKDELIAATGVASSIIADRAPKEAPIVVTCEGPRTRIYCVYDDDAIGDSEGDEAALGFDPLSGDWRVSLPCQEEDLQWVQGALAKHSSRITARDLTTGFSSDDLPKPENTEVLVLDPEGFLGR